MKYESFDRIEIVHLQDELRARWVFGLPGYHKRNSTLQADNFDRPVYHMFSIASIVDRVPTIDRSESPLTLARSLPDAQALRLAEWSDRGTNPARISSKILQINKLNRLKGQPSG